MRIVTSPCHCCLFCCTNLHILFGGSLNSLRSIHRGRTVLHSLTHRDCALSTFIRRHDSPTWPTATPSPTIPPPREERSTTPRRHGMRPDDSGDDLFEEHETIATLPVTSAPALGYSTKQFHSDINTLTNNATQAHSAIVASKQQHTSHNQHNHSSVRALPPR